MSLNNWQDELYPVAAEVVELERPPNEARAGAGPTNERGLQWPHYHIALELSPVSLAN